MPETTQLVQLIIAAVIVLIVALIEVGAAIALFVWWVRLRQPASAAAEPAPAPSSEPEPGEKAPAAPEGPGQVMIRFQALARELEAATKDLQRYNGTREVQLQGWQQMSADIIRRIMPVLENLEPFLNDENDAVADVAQLAHGRLLTELVTLGVTQIIPTPGDEFDGRCHQLNAHSTGYPPYRVKRVVAPGYRFQPRITGAAEIVVKPAEVIVESADAHPAEPVTAE